MKKLWLGCIFIMMLSCQEPTETTTDMTDLSVKRQPAEYDAQDAIWIIWSPVDHKEGISNEAVDLEIIKTLAPHTKVVVTAANEALYEVAKAKISPALIAEGKVELLQIPSEELWVRDMGPNFVELTNGKKAIVDFGFNAWGYTPSDDMDDYTIRMEKYDEVIAEHLDLPLISTEMISEGGDREVNGEGTLMVVETVEQGRNPNMNKADMEAELKRVLGVKKVIWLKEGLYEDDHTFRGTLTLEDGVEAYTVVT
ncbi:MAG: agmatine deiminase family protein, partial [Bacteroidota bacterium]